MKLNYKRTLLVGFAFFLICAFWQAYDAIVPLMLVNKFGLDQTWSGVIMSLDNVLALFMLPLFGALSDKHDTRFGKRTPFIVIGTLCAVLCFVGLTVSDNAQLFNMQASYNGEESTLREQLWDSNYEVSNSEYNNITNNQVDKTFHIQDYSARILYNKDFKD
ncbi:MAG: MFS transporter, partial [Clostridia bacterium]